MGFGAGAHQAQQKEGGGGIGHPGQAGAVGQALHGPGQHGGLGDPQQRRGAHHDGATARVGQSTHVSMDPALCRTFPLF
jgi:hypothetical protein